jgi:hypothetical protein
MDLDQPLGGTSMFKRIGARFTLVSCALALQLVGCSDGGQGTFDEQVESTSAALTGTWTPLTNAPPVNLDTCLLLTTGDVMCHEYGSSNWHRLSPDIFGSYQNGTWDHFGFSPMPPGNDVHSGVNSNGAYSFSCVNCQYGPTFYASAVLKDGHMVIFGGEYNNPGPPTGGAVWTNIGFTYDPVTDIWSNQLQDTFGPGTVGDATAVVMQDGTFVSGNAYNQGMESLNEATGVFTAINATGMKSPKTNEAGWFNLYDGTILTVDGVIASTYEIYTPSTKKWTSGATPVNMADVGVGTGSSSEIGPCVHRPDNNVMCFSGNPSGKNALYNTSTKKWSHTTSMDFPVSSGTNHFSMADAPAAALPNGNILVMASPVTTSADSNTPSHFYEMSLSNNTLTQVNETPNSPSFAAYQGRMLVLPTGEVLLTGLTIQDTMLYSNGGSPAASSRPVITANPAVIAAGGTYNISGKLFNGFSMGATYGDDAQDSTNYPLVRLTNTASGHVYYARTFNHSRMGVEPTGSTTIVTTTFEVPTNFENGPATIEVVANGIASNKVNVTTKFNALTLTNWDSFGFISAAYSVLNGIVQLKGGIETFTSSQQPFVLPAAARPSSEVYVPVTLIDGNLGRLQIDTAGNVTVVDEGGGFSNAPLFTSLENVSFAVGTSGFTPLTLQNGWVNAPFGTRNAAVKNDNGWIRFEGAVGSGSSAVLFTLPSAFRPPADTYLPIGLCNAFKGRLYIQASTGNVSVSVETGDFTRAQCFTSLEGAAFALSSTGYTAATLENGWVNAPFATRNVAFKNDDGIIRLQGAVSSGSSSVFALPPDLAPATFAQVSIDLCNGHTGYLSIGGNEISVLDPLFDSNNEGCFSSLEGVSFGFGAFAQ